MNEEARIFVKVEGRTKTRVWKIWREGNKIFRERGQLNGKMTTDPPYYGEVKNANRANEVSPEQDAKNTMLREIDKKEREGYREVNNLSDISNAEVENEIPADFSSIPRHTRFYKPQNSMNKMIEKLAASGKALFIEKRNGNMFVVIVDEDGYPRLYSSTSAPNPKNEDVPWLDRFPHLERSLTGSIPPKTILLCELVADEKKDDLDYMGSVLRSLTHTSIKFQEENKPVWLCVWDVAYLNGEKLIEELPILERLAKARNLVQDLKYLTVPSMYMKGDQLRNDVFDGSTSIALQAAKDLGIEGWVVVDPTAHYGDRFVSFHGKAERPKECCKLKPSWEADFILRWDPDNNIGTYGKGKKKDGVGAFYAYLVNRKGEEVFISKVGGGLTDEDVRTYAIPGLYMVGQVEFASVTKDNSLQFPEFIREREDKEPHECLLDQLENIKKQIGESNELI